MKIFKYSVPLKSEFIIEMPVGAKILSLQIQHNFPKIWALVDESSHIEKRKFELYGTGHEVKEGNREFIGTIQTNNGEFIWHLFERKEK